MLGSSGTGSRIPTTVNQWPPRYTTGLVLRSWIPRRSAALAPNTTAGYLAVAALRNDPWAMAPSTGTSRRRGRLGGSGDGSAGDEPAGHGPGPYTATAVTPVLRAGRDRRRCVRPAAIRSAGGRRTATGRA